MMAMDTRELILLCTLVGVVMVIIGVIGPVIIFVLSKNQKQLQKKSMEAEKIESMFKNGKITQEEAAELKKAIGLKALVPGMTPKDKHIRILSYAEILVAALAFLFLSIILIVLLTEIGRAHV